MELFNKRRDPLSNNHLRNAVYAVGYFDGSDQSYRTADDELTKCLTCLGYDRHDLNLFSFIGQCEWFYYHVLEEENLAIPLSAAYAITLSLRIDSETMMTFRRFGGKDNKLSRIMEILFPEYVAFLYRDFGTPENELLRRVAPDDFDDQISLFLMYSAMILTKRFSNDLPS